MKTTKKMTLILMVAVMLVLAGCNNKTTDEVVYDDTTAAPEATVKAEETKPEGAMLSYDGELKFTGLSNDFSVSYNDIYAMTAVDADVHNISSTGEEFDQTVTGALLEDILKANGATKKDYTGIRFVAGDGYAVTVPADIFMNKDVILAWSFDGENLDDKMMPLRVAIDDVRSMYYVSNLIEVVFETGDATATPTVGNTVVLMESAFTTMETEEFMYYDSNDTAVNAKALMKAFTSTKGDQVRFLATDGFEKTETYDVVKEGFIKINGEDAPLFTGDYLPKGMNIKYILKMAVADAMFISVNSGIEALENVEFDGDSGVNLAELVKMAGLEADTYTITATDGYSKEVTQEQLEMGMAYVDDSTTVTIKFNDADPNSSKVKNALTITAATGGKAVEAAEDEPKDGSTSDAMIGDGWMITFDGLSDGSFDMTWARADKSGKIPMVSLHTEHTKREEKFPNDWEGYKVLDILSWLKVEDFNSLIIVAGDGYEMELMKELIDDETILAHSNNGEVLTDPENMVQLVQNTEFATSWVKGVAKIIVK